MVAAGVHPSTLEHFDRSLYPVRYYFVDFSKAVRIESSADFIISTRKDMEDCGRLIEQILADVRLLLYKYFCWRTLIRRLSPPAQVPGIRAKLKSLVKAMISGEFGADDARKLLEALCKSMESSVFDVLVPPPHDRKRRTTVSTDGRFVLL
jgi:hypothetical protein